jgi:hypothetical protein
MRVHVGSSHWYYSCRCCALLMEHNQDAFEALTHRPATLLEGYLPSTSYNPSFKLHIRRLPISREPMMILWCGSDARPGSKGVYAFHWSHSVAFTYSITFPEFEGRGIFGRSHIARNRSPQLYYCCMGPFQQITTQACAHTMQGRQCRQCRPWLEVSVHEEAVFSNLMHGFIAPRYTWLASCFFT